jgi:farnesyl-diphosphate farnesyltransferase
MTRPDDLLGDPLRQVSRSFYLSLRILPRDVREPIGLAYLLARAADTVADTRLVPRSERVTHLEMLRKAFGGGVVDLEGVVTACAPHHPRAAERHLLERTDEAVARLGALPAADREAVRAVLSTLTSGMLFDLTRFPAEDASGLAALDTLDELDHYIFLVAGCVGEFWTQLHMAHRPRLANWNRAAMSAEGVRFGKALQMTNVLRDVPADLRQGRCYVPASELATLGLTPRDLLDAGAAVRARPLVHRLLLVALEHYQAGWRYTLAIPRAEWRMRLACAWPLLIGLATLGDLAAHANPLTADQPIKIARSQVRALLGRSLVTVWSNRCLSAQASTLALRVQR